MTIRTLGYSTDTNEVQVPINQRLLLPDDAQLCPASAISCSMGLPSHRYAEVRGVRGFRRAVTFGIAPMNAAGVVTNLLLYGGIATGLGYVMLRDGYLTGVSATLDAPDTHPVVIDVMVDGVAVGSATTTIATGDTKVHRELATPVPLPLGSVVRLAYSNTANVAPPNLAATVEIED